jgi:hypothetical protein
MVVHFRRFFLVLADDVSPEAIKALAEGERARRSMMVLLRPGGDAENDAANEHDAGCGASGFPKHETSLLWRSTTLSPSPLIGRNAWPGLTGSSDFSRGAVLEE